MISLSVGGQNAASDVVLWEIELQCQIAKLSVERLRNFSERQLPAALWKRIPIKGPQNLVELLADCSAFLTAASIISKMLYKGDRRKPTVAKRTQRLREILEISDLPTLQKLSVRNSFEHIDERLDDQLTQNPSGGFVQYHTTRYPPPKGLVLKRFNPETLSISYLQDTLDIGACSSEIAEVELGVPKARKAIQQGQSLT